MQGTGFSMVLACALLACGSAPPSPQVTTPPAGRAAGAVASPEAAPILPESASPIDFARMARFPEPGWSVPRTIRFSPDGKIVTFLQSEQGTDEMALWSMSLDGKAPSVLLRGSDLAGDAAKPSLAEELRNERQRKRTKGITDYHWAEAANVLLVPSGGDVYLRDASGSVSRLTDTKDPEIDPKLCADGARVAYVRGKELFVMDVAQKREAALTSKAPDGVTRGQSDFNGQEEFDEPSGFFWSPDCKKIAYLEVDEREVDEVPILGHRGGAPQLMMQRYPRAGRKNPSVSVMIADVATRRSQRVDLPAGVDPASYLARFRFTADGKSLAFWALARSQREIALVVADVQQAPKSRVAYRALRQSGWIEMPDLVLSPDGKAAFVALEQNGQHHLASLSLEPGPSPRAPRFWTEGDFGVTKVHAADDKGRVYFSSNRDDKLGRSLYRASEGAAPERLTPEKGVHDVVVSARHALVADVHSAVDRPPQVAILGGGAPQAIPVASDDDILRLRLRPIEIVTLAARDGTPLFGALLRPRTIEPGKKYPLVLMVYGGPGVQAVTDRWAPRLSWQHLADRGFFVLQVDNRGSAGRGPAFATPIAGRLGKVELDDQLAALAAILAKEPIDPGRVGIYGHSYGGFMAALAMLSAPDKFRAGIAASPVTDWRLYDSGYTERYMGTPEDNPDGYAQSDLEALAPKLEGDLLVIHALMDENVHFQHTADLIDALIKAKKRFDMFVFPGERHGYRSPEAREFAMALTTRYLVRTLGSGVPSD